jgi:hypothetical protein
MRWNSLEFNGCQTDVRTWGRLLSKLVDPVQRAGRFVCGTGLSNWSNILNCICFACMHSDCEHVVRFCRLRFIWRGFQKFLNTFISTEITEIYSNPKYKKRWPQSCMCNRLLDVGLMIAGFRKLSFSYLSWINTNKLPNWIRIQKVWSTIWMLLLCAKYNYLSLTGLQ